MCWFLPLSPGAAGQGEAEGSPHPSGCPRDPSPFQGLPWSTPGCVPPSQGALSPQPCPGSLTTSPSTSSWIFGLLLQGKAKQSLFPSPFSCSCILMCLELSGRKMLFPFYQLGAHTRLPGSLPALLCFPRSSPRRQRCVSSLICLAAPTGGLAPGLITHSPAPAGETGSCPFSPPATNFKGPGGQGRYH